VGYFGADSQPNTRSYVLINGFIENSSITFISKVKIHHMLQMQ